MLRKILSFFFALFMFLPTAHSAEMVNVEYIHQYLNARWGIDLPYNPELKNPKVAANMEYLLTVVDIANEYLNGEKTTNYGTGEYATKLAADTIATNTAIDTLVHGPSFYITTTPDTTEFHIIIAAAGDFVIDWGDREYEFISDKQLGKTVYSHTYASPGEYLVRLSGTATDYYNNAGSSNIVADITFYDYTSSKTNSQHIAKISGSLGDVFPTLPDGTNPTFYRTFRDAENLTEIPANLFGELNGDGAPYMFDSTFYECEQLQTVEGPLFSGTITPAESMFKQTFSTSGLTSVPANLFGELNGDGAPNMFERTFQYCYQLQTVGGPLFNGTITPAEYMFNETFSASGLTSIPADLFAGISGAPAKSMFSNTFYRTNITSVPANLFGELNGDGAPYMFEWTFYMCDQLQTIEGPLFSGTITPAENMFDQTFYYSSMTSIPADLFAGVQGAPAASMFSNTFSHSGLTNIPANLFAGVRGAPANSMFYSTFSDTRITSIPANLFSGIQGAPASGMFADTFNNTPITSIPENLFAGISGPAARNMFGFTFNDCTSLTGPSAQTNGQYLYEIWPDAGYQGTYSDATGLSDYAQIPSRWK
ncbi:MAG: hypothetical protein IAC69_01805 [Proteobacteria bacterium]|uniref:PKD domain-containing protein n=1 Tax=Candidatus Enterousia avistercoris TaxID=2840788 RepID=A0A9D9GUN5_9PROT|nr:hypothetical protein [Candidatus Enterousia avistercoris]